MLQIDNLVRKAGDFRLHIDQLLVSKGDYLVLLGPSGSGKTMLLELISGLERCDNGKIWLNGNDITDIPSGRRGVGLVFQKQWLFPHLTVAENISFGLNTKHLRKDQIESEVNRLATETHCQHLLHRKADMLSGGEAQRVAIARALATQPKILLLDEPMSNLDNTLRTGISSLLRQLNRNGITILHVTHDYTEALALASEVAVMHQGTIVQKGSLNEVFTRPRNAFVAGFAGIRNFLRGTLLPPVDNESSLTAFRTGPLVIHLSHSTSDRLNSMHGYITVAAESIILSTERVISSAVNQFRGVVSDLFETHDGVEVVVDVEGVLFNVMITRESAQRLQLRPSSEVYIQFKAGSVRFAPE